MQRVKISSVKKLALLCVTLSYCSVIFASKATICHAKTSMALPYQDNFRVNNRDEGYIAKVTKIIRCVGRSEACPRIKVGDWFYYKNAVNFKTYDIPSIERQSKGNLGIEYTCRAGDDGSAQIETIELK